MGKKLKQFPKLQLCNINPKVRQSPPTNGNDKKFAIILSLNSLGKENFLKPVEGVCLISFRTIGPNDRCFKTFFGEKLPQNLEIEQQCVLVHEHTNAVFLLLKWPIPAVSA